MTKLNSVQHAPSRNAHKSMLVIRFLGLTISKNLLLSVKKGDKDFIFTYDSNEK